MSQTPKLKPSGLEQSANSKDVARKTTKEFKKIKLTNSAKIHQQVSFLPEVFKIKYQSIGVHYVAKNRKNAF